VPHQTAAARARELLGELYADRFGALFDARWASLKKSPNDSRAMLFFTAGPFDLSWERLARESSDDRVFFLLARISALHADPDAAKKLIEFPGPQVLRAASKTYWPIQLEPLERDGAYLWSIRASSLEGRTAKSVLQISIDDTNPEKAKADAHWVHFHLFDEFVYLWRRERPWAGTIGVAYGVNRAAYNSMYGTIDAGFTRGVLIHSIPDGVRVPTTQISDDEFSNWCIGDVYEWSRDLFPSPYQERLRLKTSTVSPRSPGAKSTK